MAPDLYDQPDVEVINALNLVYLAKWVGVPPWELADQPVLWTELIALAAEVERVRMSRNAKALPEEGQ